MLTVPGGEHLFEHLQAEPFDLLLLDIMMPKVDGLQLLQRVKSDPRFKDLPVLMISSMPPEEATVRSLGLGAADFIPEAVPGAGAAGAGEGASPGGPRAQPGPGGGALALRDDRHHAGGDGLAQAGGDLPDPRPAGGARAQHLPLLDRHRRARRRDRHGGGGVREPDAAQPVGGPRQVSRDPARAGHGRSGAGPGRHHRSAVRGSPPRLVQRRPAGADPLGDRAPILAPRRSRPACSSSAPPPRTRRSTSRTCSSPSR